MLAAFFSDFIQQPVIPRKERKEKLTMVWNDCDEWKAWPEIANDKYREGERTSCGCFQASAMANSRKTRT